MIGVDVAPRRTLHLRRGHGAHRRTKSVVPVKRQVVDQHIAEARRGSSCGLERPRQLQRDVLLRFLQLGVRHRIIADAAQFLQELDERTVGLRGYDGGGSHEVTGETARGEAARRAVGIAVRFAQVLVEPAGERATEDRIQDLNRRVIRCAPRDSGLAHADHGLSRARFVDEIERSRAGRRRFRLWERRNDTARPGGPPEARGEETLRLGERNVAHHENLRGVGPIGAPVKRHHAIVRQLGRRRVVARRRMPVRMCRPEHDRGERNARHGDRLIPLLQDRRGEQSALPRDLGIGELRAQQHVGKQIERRVEVSARHMQANGDGVEVADSGELGAEVGDFVRQCERAAGAGALRQHVGRERGEPGHVRRIARGPGVHENLHLDHRHLMHLHDGKRQPIGQPDGTHGGKV